MKKIIYMLVGVGLLFGCSKGEKPTENDKVSQCFMSKDYKYEELLTKADVSKHIPIDDASYKMNISSTKGEYGSCTYEWSSDRPDLEMEISGQIVRGPDKNRVTIKMLDFYTDSDLKLYSQASIIDLFDQGYRRLSQQEYDELLANIRKKFENKPSEFEQAKGFLDTRMKSKYEPVDGLGTSAFWKWDDNYGVELVVLTGATKFTIANKTSGDKNAALTHAVKFAKEVIAKCQ